jgi:hypothetical protein
MNRLRDYMGFAVCFAGLGYLAIWPLSVNGSTGTLFGASILCRAAAPALLSKLCRAPHPLTLSPTLHALGVLSAAAAALLYCCRTFNRARQAPGADANMQIAGGTPPPRPPRPLPRVKPRSEFGLRGRRR